LFNQALLVTGLGLVFFLGSISHFFSESVSNALGFASFFLVAGFLSFTSKSISSLAKSTKEIVDDELGQFVYFGDVSDLSQIQLALKMKDAELTAATGRVLDASKHIDASMNKSLEISKETSQKLSNQQSETEQSAAAMHEMSATVHEVAQSTCKVSDYANEALDTSKLGYSQLQSSTGAISELANELKEVVSLVLDLDEKSKSIATVTEVIGGIAEQTNLLALNAAIEAARAGEQGRGFAVVADEVRTLAKGTQDSTIEIQRVVSEIKNSIQSAVEQISVADKRAVDCVDQNNLVLDSFSNIRNQTDQIAGLAVQVAAAVEEQSIVANDISENVNNISELADSANAQGLQMLENQLDLKQELDQSLKLIGKFAKI